jgi:quercetin dioxygenase-like cupin family protein
MSGGSGSLPQVAAVSFEDGAHTNWHAHAGGQILYIIEGSGQAATESDGPIDLRPGDVVVTPPGERHWHGASEGESMTHLAISFGATEWFDRVDRQA